MTRLKKFIKRIFESEPKSRSHFGVSSSTSTMGDARTSKVAISEAPVISAIFDDPMRSVRNRLQSFNAADVSSDAVEGLARAGFFYNSAIRRIQCFSCCVRFDYPIDCSVSELELRHRETATECEFTKNPAKAGNINDMYGRSVVTSGSTLSNNSSASQDVTSDMPSRSENGNSSSSPPRIDSPNNVMFQQPSIPPRNTFNRNMVDYPRLKSEEERLRTFRSVLNPWPVPFIRPEDCARAGFFFVGDADKVQCAFCRGVAGEWEEGDIPWIEHQRHFPRCPFICNLPVGNVPIGAEDEVQPSAAAPSVSPPGRDECGPFGIESMGVYRPGGSSNHVVGAHPYTNSMQSAEELKIKPFRGPANSKMVSPHARLNTFMNGKWPQDLGISAETMADAGFYYTGAEDQVKCFYCDGGLKSWVGTDNPWVEHAKWFPFCTHVLLNKGDEFVQNAEATLAPAAVSSASSSDDDDVTMGVEAMEIETEKPCSSTASSSGVETASERGLSPTVSSFSSGDEDNEPSTSARCTEPEKEIHSQLTCKICMDKEVGVVFLPCGHLVSCPSCATACKTCAVCRKRIQGVVRAYLS